MRISQSQSRRAFTRLELAVAIMVIAVLMVFFPVSFTSGKAKAARINCVHNLRSIGLAFRMWSNDNEDKYPWQVSTNSMTTNIPGTLELIPLMAPELHFRAISNELGTAKVLLCPADSERQWAKNWKTFTRSNLSYFVNLDANGTNLQTVLIGDRNLMLNSNIVKPGLVLITTNQILGWNKNLHNERGNLVLADGSGQQSNYRQLNEHFQASSLPTNRLVIP